MNTFRCIGCVIIQFISVFITPHLYTLSSLFLLLHCHKRDYFVVFELCQEIMTSVYSCSYSLGPMGQILQPSSCCIVSQGNTNFCLHQFIEE